MSTHDAGRTDRWAELHARLARVQEHVTKDALGGADERSVLAERARVLARPVATAADDEATPMVVFRLEGERFAVPTAESRGVFRVADAALLPGAEPPLVAVMMHRGDLLMLVDLRAGLGLSAGQLEDLPRVLVLETPRGRLGVLIDEVIGVEMVRDDAVHAPAGRTRAYVRGVTGDAITVLETSALSRAES